MATRPTPCAFANDLPNRRRPGVVFIGVRDDGTPTGLAINDALLLKLAHCKPDGNILPLPTMTVGKHVLGGKEVAVITVAPADSPPVRCRGRIWIRTGPRRALASAQDERLLNEKRRHGDAPFDLRPVRSATLADLDLPRFQYLYLPQAFDAEVLAQNDRTVEERLAATKMIVAADDPAPTVLGLPMLGAKPTDFLPGAYVQFLLFAGIDSAQFDGPVQETMRDLDAMLRSHIRTSVEIGTERTEVRRATYPLPALVRNAVMHRSFEATNSPCRYPGCRPHRGRQPGRSLWRCHHGDVRPAWSDRLPQSESRRGDARLRSGAALRGGHSPRPPGAAHQQPAAAGVRCERSPGAVHRARTPGLAGQPP